MEREREADASQLSEASVGPRDPILGAPTPTDVGVEQGAASFRLPSLVETGLLERKVTLGSGTSNTNIPRALTSTTANASATTSSTLVATPTSTLPVAMGKPPKKIAAASSRPTNYPLPPISNAVSAPYVTTHGTLTGMHVGGPAWPPPAFPSGIRTSDSRPSPMPNYYTTYVPVVWRPRFGDHVVGTTSTGAPIYYGPPLDVPPSRLPMNMPSQYYHHPQYQNAVVPSTTSPHHQQQRQQQQQQSRTAAPVYYTGPYQPLQAMPGHYPISDSYGPAGGLTTYEERSNISGSMTSGMSGGSLDALVAVAGDAPENKENHNMAGITDYHHRHLQQQQHAHHGMSSPSPSSSYNIHHPTPLPGGKFACNQPGCGKSFPSRSRLQRHLLVHTGLKPFACLYSTCNRKFSRRDNMLQHYRTHVVRVGPHQPGGAPSIISVRSDEGAREAEEQEDDGEDGDEGEENDEDEEGAGESETSTEEYEVEDVDRQGDTSSKRSTLPASTFVNGPRALGEAESGGGKRQRTAK